MGIISGIDVSSTNNIKMPTMSPHNQPLAVGMVAAFSFQAYHPSMLCHKFLLMAQLRACKKLKIPLGKLKVQWRMYDSDEMIEDPIIP